MTKFLYFEDDPPSRMVMKVLIERVMGFPDITIFEENHDFMQKVKSMPYVPDVVFLDIQMHPYSGYEMLQMLRSDPAFQQAKIIAMTANVMATDVEELKKAGFDGLIGKPIIRTVFPQLLEQILSGESVWYVA